MKTPPMMLTDAIHAAYHNDPVEAKLRLAQVRQVMAEITRHLDMAASATDPREIMQHMVSAAREMRQ